MAQPAATVARPVVVTRQTAEAVQSVVEATARPAAEQAAQAAATLRPSVFDALETVPAWLHQAPDEGAVRGGDRYAAAEVLDRELGPLAHREAHLRFVLAHLAAEFVRRRLWMRLGFARIGDYSAERLGLAARTLQEDARVATALRALPVLQAAFMQQAISWTHLRLLTTVASAGDERAWLEYACAHTTRELEARVKEARAEAVRSANEAGAHAVGDSPDDSASQDDESSDPLLLWTMRCTREGRKLWRACCEMASRVAGTKLAPWQAAECVAAEALSGPRAEPEITGSVSSRAGRAEPAVGELPPGRAGSALHPWLPGNARSRPALGPVADSWRRRSERWIDNFAGECGCAEGFASLAPLRRGPSLPADLGALLDGIGEADAFELDRRMRLAQRAMQRIDWQLGTILRFVLDHRLYMDLGFATFRLYVEGRLGICGSKGWGLVRLERHSLHQSPALREAYRYGRISWLATAMLLPVISEQHERAWIERAGEVTLRRLMAEVSWVLDRRDEPGGEQCQPPPPIDLDVTADSLRRVDEEPVQMRARSAGADGLDPLRRRYGLAAAVTLRAPASVIGLLEEAIEHHRSSGEPGWRAFERMLARAFLTWTALPRHHDPVFERDGWTCRVPACSSRRNLHDHHVLFRSHGGGNERANRVVVCAAHHHHGIHAGYVRAGGRAPDRIVWELGARRGGPPLVRTLGDRYMSAPPR